MASIESDLRWALSDCGDSRMTELTVFEAGEACTCELPPALLRQLVDLLTARLSVVEAND
jgi:hypothetical protein